MAKTAAFLQSIDKNIKTYSELVDLLEKSIDDNPMYFLLRTAA